MSSSTWSWRVSILSFWLKNLFLNHFTSHMNFFSLQWHHMRIMGYYWQLNSLFNSLFRIIKKITSKLFIISPLRGESTSHQGLVMRKAFSYHDITMWGNINIQMHFHHFWALRRYDAWRQWLTDGILYDDLQQAYILLKETLVELKMNLESKYSKSCTYHPPTVIAKKKKEQLECLHSENTVTF